MDNEGISRHWRPKRRQVLWATGMLVALVALALLVADLPGSWGELIKDPLAMLEGQATELTLIVLVLTAIIVLLTVGGASLGWTGFADKTLWDWLQLLSALAIPVVVGVGGVWLTMQQDERQRTTEDQRAEAAALQTYLNQMGTLILEDDLLVSKPDSHIRTLARARTLTVLRRLNPDRKSRVLEFLLEAELLQRTETTNPVINLRGADLKEVVLPDDTDLSYTDLSGADLSGADLSEANLSSAYMIDANLSGADLSRATLSLADLGLADLSGAILSEADLTGARLNDTDLSDADVTGADLWHADLSDATGVTEAALVEQAGYVGETTMPDGEKRREGSTTVSDYIKEYPEGKLPSGVAGEPLEAREYDTDDFVTGFEFELPENWVMAGTEAADDLSLCDEWVEDEEDPFCRKLLSFTSPLYVYDEGNPTAYKKIPSPESADGWMSWLQSHPGLDATNAAPVNIGGAPGHRIDVTTTSTQFVPLYPTSRDTVGGAQEWKDRFFIVDVAEETVIIDVTAPAAEFDAWLREVKKSKGTVEWKGE